MIENITKTTIHTVSCPPVSNTLMNSDTNIIVPDSRPDAGEVVMVSLRPIIEEKRVQKDYITLTGNLDYELIYTPEGGGNPVAVATRVPFTHQLEVAGGEGAHISVKPNVVSASATVANSRKINIKSTIEFDTNALLPIEYEVVSKEGCDMPCRADSVSCSCLASFCERDFEVGGVLPGKAVPAEILSTRVFVDSSEIKYLNGKPVAKGVIRGEALYVDEEGNLAVAVGDFPFTEPLGCEGEMVSAELDFVLRDATFSIHTGSEGKVIKGEFAYTVTAFLYEDCKREIITDIYSPDFNLATAKSDLTFCSVTSYKDECAVRETMPLSRGEAVAVFGTSVMAEIEDIKITPSATRAIGKSRVTLCITDTYGKVYTVEKEFPFDCALDIRTDKDDRVNVVVEAECVSADLINPSSAEVRFTLCFNTRVDTTCTLPCILDVKATEDASYATPMPSVVLYFPSPD